MTKINVGYIVSGLAPGGPTTQLLNLLENLDRKDFSPILITLRKPSDGIKEYIVRELGLRFICLRLPPVLAVFMAPLILLYLARKYRITLFHSQGFFGDCLNSLMLYGRFRLTTVRNFPQNDYYVFASSRWGRVFCWLHICFLHKIKNAVSVSNAVKENLAKNFGITAIKVIYNGVDTNRFFAPNLPNKLALREYYSFPLKGTVWVYLGHLSSLKNVIFLVKSWMSVAPKDAHLFLIGDGDLMTECRRISNTRNNVHVMGHVREPNEYLNLADFYISASNSEGMPNSVIEALASGLPLLLSAIPAHVEILSKCTDIGYVFREDDVNDFAKGVSRLLSISRDEVSAKSRNVASEFFDSKRMAKMYSEVYKSLIAEAKD
jgi:glycosyltransferase involved in cell wall biosynthesis